MPAIPEKVNFGIQMPIFYDVYLRRLSYIKGKARATMASDLIQGQVDAELDRIKDMWAELAESSGVTPEELDSLAGISPETSKK